MRKIRKQIVIPLLLVLVTAACVPPTVVATPTTTANQTTTKQEATEIPVEIATEPSITATSQPEPVVQPTPRGPDLVASNPANVQLASGQLQLVEFFRFT